MNVVTLVHGREEHLRNLIRGLEGSTLMPDALWVVFMNQPAQPLSSTAFPIHTLEVGQQGKALPLAMARNSLRPLQDDAPWVFLDVDCIASSGLLEHYRQALRAYPEALHMGEVRYLPPGGADIPWNEADLLERAARHPLSQYRPAPGEPMAHHLFWSLNFACRGAVFERIGGFDEAYVGYGGEDTDFAFRARKRGVALRAANALAFHQYHDAYDPPLNHFAAIVANARRFYARWQLWPMEGWLTAFAQRGLIAWHDDRLDVLRPPLPEETQACLNQAHQGF